MIIKEHIIGALSSIASNKLRAGLSMLGIVIGVFSIIVMLAIGEGTTSKIVSQLSSMGADLITVTPGSRNQSNVRWSAGGSSPNLIDDQFLEFVRGIQGVKEISPTVSTSKQLIYKTYNTNAQILGVSGTYQILKNITLQNGRFIDETDVKKVNDSIVLGATLATSAFGTEDPIGKEIKLQNSIFTVIGVLTDNSQTNNRVFLPISTVMLKILGTHYYSSIDIQVTDASQIANMKNFITTELNRYLKVTDATVEKFTINSLSEVVSSLESVSATMSMLLWGIAAISLLVWGIGVMNIMLVSVTERTKEIGIRKAIWATKQDILMQFLVESIIISIFAWFIGIGWSFLIVYLISQFMTAIITTNSVIIAFVSVACIGVFFGILPASKASKLRPIDALRHE